MRKRLLAFMLVLVAFLLSATDVLAFGLPRLTTDPSNPVLYYIRNTRGVSAGKANYWTSSNTLSTSESAAAVVYFVGSISNGTATVKIINNADGKQLNKSLQWADEGIDWYIQERTSDQGGKDAGGYLAYKGVVISSGLNADGTVASYGTSTSYNGTIDGCWYASSSYDKVRCYTPTFDGSIFSLEPLNVFPEMTTDTSKPIYYRLYHMYSGRYFKATESGHELVSNAAEASLYYFTENTGKETDGRIYVHTWSPDVPGKITHSATAWKEPSAITRHWYFKKQTNSCYTGFITAHDDNSDPWKAGSGDTKIGYAGSSGVNYKGNIFNVEYVPSDLIELGDYVVSANPGNVTLHQIEGGITLSYPNAICSTDEKVTLKNNHGIQVNGVTANVQFADNTLTIKNLPTTGSFTITIPAGAIGFQTSGVTNKAISLTYNIITGVLPKAKQGYLYTMVNDSPQFLTRNNTWHTRAVLGDYGTPVEVEATDGENNTIITFLDSQMKLYSSTDTELYCDGTDNNIIFQIMPVPDSDGKYRLKANNSKAKGYVGVRSVVKLTENATEGDALVWQFMNLSDYNDLMDQRVQSQKVATLSKVGMSLADFNDAQREVIKNREATGTAEITEIYDTRSQSNPNIVEWEYDVDPGLYIVKLNAFMRNSGGDAYTKYIQSGFDSHQTSFYANGDSILIHAAWDGRQPSAIPSGNCTAIVVGGQTQYIPFDLNTAGELFSNSHLYSNELLTYVDTDGKLSIHLYNHSYAPYCWLPYRDLTIERVIINIDDTKQMAISEINGYDGDDTFEALAATAIANIEAATTREEINNELKTVRDAFTAYTYGISDWMNVSLTTNIENEDVKNFLDAANYNFIGAKYILTEENRVENDRPRAITIPVKRNQENVTVSISTTNDYADAFTLTASAAAGTIDCHYNAIPGYTYYYKVEDGSHTTLTQGQIAVEGTVRMIYTEKGSNIRDLGGRITVDGKRVKYGRIFRGGEMHAGDQTTLSAEDIAEMKRLGIKAELDLRQNNEVHNNTASAIPGAEYLYVNWVDGGSAIVTDPSYHNIIGNCVKFIADNLKTGNVYYHCIWGADRTGAMSMIIESILGVQLTDILKDYQLTSFSKAGLRPGGSFNMEGKLLAIQDAVDANGQPLYPGNTMQEKVVSYLKVSCGVTDDDINTIRTELLEDNADYVASYVSTLKATYSQVAIAAGTTFNSDASSIADVKSAFSSTMNNLTEEKDLTSLLHNAAFEENGGSLDNWATRGDGCGKGGSTNHVGRIFDTTGSIRQTLQNMPAGTYTIKVQAFNRKGSGQAETTKGEGYQKYVSGEQKATAYLKANDSKVILRNIYEDAMPTEYASGYNPAYGIYVPENTTSGSAALSSATDGGRLYWNVATVTLTEPGDLTIGIVAPENIAGDYTVIDNFKLYYKGTSAAGTPELNLDQTTANTLPTEDGYYNVTSNRTLSAGKWNTLCLPYDITADQLEANHITAVRTISGIEDKGENSTISFAEASEIKAGRPYIVMVSEDVTLGGDNILVRAKNPVGFSFENGLSMTGNYNPTTLNGSYYISGNKFYYADTDVNMKAFRASITVPAGMEVKSFGIDDMLETAIEQLNNDEVASSKVIYDLSGRKVAPSSLRKGIYIINGKKVTK